MGTTEVFCPGTQIASCRDLLPDKPSPRPLLTADLFCLCSQQTLSKTAGPGAAEPSPPIISRRRGEERGQPPARVRGPSLGPLHSGRLAPMDSSLWGSSASTLTLQGTFGKPPMPPVAFNPDQASH